MAMDISHVTPEYLAETRVPALLATVYITRAIAFIFLGLRVYAKRRAGIKFGWEDYVLLITFSILLGAIPLEALAVEYGLGRHVEYVFMFKQSTLGGYGKALYAEQLLYSPLIGPIKLSILFWYIRMFGHNQATRLACIIQIVGVILWTLVTFFLFAFQCTPIHVGWNITRQGGTCFEYSPLFIGTNTINVVMDFAILITPIPVVWGLQLPPKKKFWVMFVLAFGACEVIFSSIRLGVLAKVVFTDPTWQHVDAFIWSLVECHIGVICACLPLLAPLLPGRARFGTTRQTGMYGSGVKRSALQTPLGYSNMDRTNGKFELSERSNSASDTNGILHTVEWSVSAEQGAVVDNMNKHPFEHRTSPRDVV